MKGYKVIMMKLYNIMCYSKLLLLPLVFLLFFCGSTTCCGLAASASVLGIPDSAEERRQSGYTAVNAVAVPLAAELVSFGSMWEKENFMLNVFGDHCAWLAFSKSHPGDINREMVDAKTQGIVRTYSGLSQEDFAFMTEELRGKVKPFSITPNLIANPEFAPIQGRNMPADWIQGNNGMMHDTKFHYMPPKDNQPGTIGISGGRDRQGQWSSQLPRCEKGARYRFTGDFLRQGRNSDAYAEVLIWDQRIVLNTHRLYGHYQQLHASVECPKNQNDRRFVFQNTWPDVSFWLRNPRLVREQHAVVPQHSPPENTFFPIGAYGGSGDTLAQFRETGLNSAVLALNEKNLDACNRGDIHCTFAVPRDRAKLLVALSAMNGKISDRNFSFYVNDEPGIHSFPPATAADMQRLLKRHFPDVSTCMAIVRPQVIPDYQEGADYFMLDQYPVPNMPMTWLSDSLDEAAGYVGRDRLQAVIQAFGGAQHARYGWPRLPTFAEMNCLAFLAVIHGARGIYFFAYPEIMATAQGRDDFNRVIARLNSLYSWLQVKNRKQPVTVSMVSKNRFDPQGRAAVHCTEKMQHDTTLLMCVNTIRTFVEAEVLMPHKTNTVWEEYYSGDAYYVVDGKIFSRFAPLEVKVLLEHK